MMHCPVHACPRHQSMIKPAPTVKRSVVLVGLGISLPLWLGLWCLILWLAR